MLFRSPNPNETTAEDDHSRWWSRDQLAQCLQGGGCLICRALARFEAKNIHSFLYEGMMLPDVRKQFLAGGGFCRRHCLIALAIEDECWPAGGIGMAMLCEDLLRLALDALGKTKTTDRRSPAAQRRDGAQLFRPSGSCIFCNDSRRKEEILIEALEGFAAEEQFRQALQARGLCIWHGELAINQWKSEEVRAWISAIMFERMRTVAGNLREAIRKHDHTHQQEKRPERREAVLRAMELLAGTWEMHSAQENQE